MFVNIAFFEFFNVGDDEGRYLARYPCSEEEEEEEEEEDKEEDIPFLKIRERFQILFT